MLEEYANKPTYQNSNQFIEPRGWITITQSFSLKIK